MTESSAAGLWDQAQQHAAPAEADYRLRLEAIAAERIATATPSLDSPRSTSTEFSTPLHSGS